MRTRSQDVTEILRDWILTGTVTGGERLEEIPLAEKLGVSRTPVRAALTLLANEGLLDYQPKRGYLVRTFGADEVFAAYEVRATLEGLACRLAATSGIPDAAAATLWACVEEGDRYLAKGYLAEEDFRPYQAMNVTFHETILKLSGNVWAERFVNQTHGIPFVSDRIILWHDYGVILRSHNDHHRITEALIRRQSARAEDLMREHVYFAGLFLKENFHRIGRGADNGADKI
ncbi:GntR family transcriptional regulator [Phreatobacter stygius]|uniref:GntR family transcriptional regulator n=1 Tax=Phreatobacter stygius TaxID=1940610 RepID=A0A4D7B2A7_9HYPH|nr:GntR family transcriptional regulator [Phreatobacter stygius]QCI66961.1 GntR family transcriptional regulator [Phreatobacter stygius]